MYLEDATTSSYLNILELFRQGNTIDEWHKNVFTRQVFETRVGFDVTSCHWDEGTLTAH